ncbi:MAG: ATP synthase F1 subunit delta [Patescibacteria group bacterium]|jgi:F-type H+-transporting ATPase subunit delta|nr:ATP synthase F1 subunit delta [Patescibacteria group bacterium]
MKSLARQYALSLFNLLESESKESWSALIKDWTDLLIENGDYKLVDEIIIEFSKIWDQEKKELKAVLSSAYPLLDESRQLVMEYLKTKTDSKMISLKEEIDEDILGGVVLRYDDKVIDASLKNNLNNLKSNIKK